MGVGDESPPPKVATAQTGAVYSARAVFWSSLVLSGIVVVVAMWLFVDPAPPDRIRIATGVEGGFYDTLGHRFRAGLVRYGLKVELVPTAGSAENLVRLEDDDPVDAGFVQGGVGSPEAHPDLRALASLAIEPLWLFGRGVTSFRDVASTGARIAAGSPGSGTRDLVETIVRLYGASDRFTFVDLNGEAAVEALLDGDVDLAAFVTTAETRWVTQLLRAPEASLMDIGSLSALTRRLPFAMAVELPAHVISLADGVPKRDSELLGVATQLVVRSSLHPAIKQILLQVSTEVIDGNRLLGTVGRFPSPRYVEYPLDSEADRYFSKGPTPVRRYLPFWAANLFERFWVLIIPVATLIIPLLRFGPVTVQWSMRRRIYRWYKKLRDVEMAAAAASTPAERATVLADLEAVEAQVREIRVPLAFRDDLYRLRTHVAFVREALAHDHASSARSPAATPPG